MKKAGWAEVLKQDVASLQLGQLLFPLVGNRTFFREKRPRAKLEDDWAELFVVDPVFPFFQVPDTTCHDDRHIIEAQLAHDVPELKHVGMGRPAWSGLQRSTGRCDRQRAMGLHTQHRPEDRLRF